ncbi:MAG: serine hydrolase [Actinobacteria bacterium]|uniref:Unannotated protein n=1 Tax=freshwater metagenome TaxID=449393 RepID=A0A6J6P5L1_9ZZZZ|nr:serine hydrolase [Actinomycetota bacterium]
MTDGECTTAFEPLRDLLARHLDDGTDLGAAVAVVHRGDLVADLWGGQARPGVAWERDTIVQVWSVTKTLAALVVLALADRGDLELDAPAARYWPAFAAHGKGEVTVAQLLGHTSGVPGWSRPVSVEDLLDLELSEGWLAEESPWYEPGTSSAYQILNHGHLLDAVVRGATGRPLADVLRELLASTGSEFFLGVPVDALGRCADLVPPDSTSVDIATMPPDHFLLRTIANPFLTMPVVNGETWRRGEVGAAGGHGNARGIALAHSRLLATLGPATIDAMLTVQASGPDLVLGVPITFGTGFALPGASSPAVPEGRVCWWTGYGGAIVVNDLDREVTVAYTPNRLVDHMVASPRTDAYLATAFACVEAL